MGIIGSIRKHSWVAVLIVGIAIVAFIIGDLSKNNRTETFAEIDGNKVTYDYYQRRLTEREKENQMEGNSNYSFKDAVWQEIVQERVLDKEMNALGINVSDEEVSDMFLGRFIHPWVRQQFTNPQTGAFDAQLMNNVVRQYNDMPDTSEMKQQWMKFQSQVRDDRKRNKYFTMIVAGLYMPNKIADKIAEMSTKSSDVRLAVLRYGQSPDVKVELTDADYQKYYEEHKKELNYSMFRMENREIREVAYAVFTAQPSQADMQEIESEVQDWWNQIQTMDNNAIIDFANMHSQHGYIYDSTFMSSSDFAAPLDTVIRNAHAGQFITPRVVNTIMKNERMRLNYGQYVMGKVLATEMRPDSLRASVIFIPNQNYHNSIPTTVEQAAARRDSAMASIKGGMTFEEAVVKYSIDTNKLGDQGWTPDGPGELNWMIVHHSVGDVFNYDLPNDAGHLVVKVTGKTTPVQKYRVAMISKEIVPSNTTVNAVRDDANQFASQYATCQAMIEGAQSSNVQLRNAMLIAMSDSLTGYTNTRDAVRWAFDEKTLTNAISGEIYPSDFSYIVVGLRDVYVPNKLTLDQARPLIEQPLRNEKEGDLLAEKAKKAMQGTQDINVIASNLGVTVDTVTGVTFNADRMGQNSMEYKAVATIAAKNTTGLVGPVKGSWGVYVINIDNNSKVEKGDVNAIRMQYERIGRNATGALIPVLKNRIKVDDSGLRRL